MASKQTHFFAHLNVRQLTVTKMRFYPITVILVNLSILRMTIQLLFQHIKLDYSRVMDRLY